MAKSYEARFDEMWKKWKEKGKAECLKTTKSSFQLMKRVEAADLQGLVTCCSCPKRSHYKRMDGGHYLPAKSSTATCFHEQNCHPQCKKCNKWESGNLIEYRKFLVKRYGEDAVQELESLRGFRTWEKWELIDMRIGFMDRIKAAQLRLNDGS